MIIWGHAPNGKKICFFAIEVSSIPVSGELVPLKSSLPALRLTWWQLLQAPFHIGAEKVSKGPSVETGPSYVCYDTPMRHLTSHVYFVSQWWGKEQIHSLCERKSKHMLLFSLTQFFKRWHYLCVKKSLLKPWFFFDWEILNDMMTSVLFLPNDAGLWTLAHGWPSALILWCFQKDWFFFYFSVLCLVYTLQINTTMDNLYNTFKKLH